MTTTMDRPHVQHHTTQDPRADACPKCGGQLATNQDGWKICHACGYASPQYAPEPTGLQDGIVTRTV